MHRSSVFGRFHRKGKWLKPKNSAPIESSQQFGNASGIFNLVRNIGGSAGISLSQTLLTRRTDVHQNEIVNSVGRTQQWFRQLMSGLARFPGHDLNSANALRGAESTLYRGLGRQALLWA